MAAVAAAAGRPALTVVCWSSAGWLTSSAGSRVGNVRGGRSNATATTDFTAKNEVV